MMGSFKLKLVATFLALALLPLAAAYWTFRGVADRSVTSTVDARLGAGLRAAVAAFEDEQREAESAARELARSDAFQDALAERDEAELRELLEPTPNVRVETADGLVVGSTPDVAAEASVSLLGPGSRSATVVAAVPLDEALLRRLHVRSGLGRPDVLVLVGDERIRAASDADVAGPIDLPAGRTTTTAAVGGDDRYRAVAVRLVPDESVRLAALTPQSAIAGEQRSLRGRILAALAASLLLIGAFAYVAGRSIVGALGRLAAAANSIAAGRLRERVPVTGRDEFGELAQAFNRMASQLEARVGDLEAERARLRDATTRFGEALAATLDPAELRRIVVESAVEATNAAGGRLHASDGAVVTIGDTTAGPDRLELELTAGRESFGTLVLFGDRFDGEASMTAASLVGQAVVALENARLHRRMEQHALVDALTGLGNRRQAEEWIQNALAAANRQGGRVSLILGDLDDFKAINDDHGHPAGDEVLRAVAQALRETVREMDHPARWGGEEFAVVLPATGIDGAAQVAERLRESIAAQRVRTPDGVRLAVTASFGVGSVGGSGSLAQLLEAADEALYRAKRAGKNRVDTGIGAVANG